jgi:hypothetical protein
MLGPGEFLRAPVVGDITRDKDGIKCCAPLFAEVLEESLANLGVAIKLRTSVRGRDVQIGKMEEGQHTSIKTLGARFLLECEPGARKSGPGGNWLGSGFSAFTLCGASETNSRSRVYIDSAMIARKMFVDCSPIAVTLLGVGVA